MLPFRKPDRITNEIDILQICWSESSREKINLVLQWFEHYECKLYFKILCVFQIPNES